MKQGEAAMEFDLENPLTDQEQESETVHDLFAVESDHMPLHGFLLRLRTSDFHASFRRQAISLILKAQFSANLDPLLSYLAVNCMDRFISRHEIQEEKPWALRLIAVSCLSLAAKMKTAPFSLSSLQREEGLVFNAQSVHRMELVILDALNWRMRSITPFSFVQFFSSLFQLQDPPLTQALKDRASHIIFKSHHEVKFLEFKPSVIAASALLSASYELFPVQFQPFNRSILSCGYMNQESLVQCFNAMQEMVVDGGNESVLETALSTRTPMSVSGDCNNNSNNNDNEQREEGQQEEEGEWFVQWGKVPSLTDSTLLEERAWIGDGYYERTDKLVHVMSVPFTYQLSITHQKQDSPKKRNKKGTTTSTRVVNSSLH